MSRPLSNTISFSSLSHSFSLLLALSLSLSLSLTRTLSVSIYLSFSSQTPLTLSLCLLFYSSLFYMWLSLSSHIFYFTNMYYSSSTLSLSLSRLFYLSLTDSLTQSFLSDISNPLSLSVIIFILSPLCPTNSFYHIYHSSNNTVFLYVSLSLCFLTLYRFSFYEPSHSIPSLI